MDDTFRLSLADESHGHPPPRCPVPGPIANIGQPLSTQDLLLLLGGFVRMRPKGLSRQAFKKMTRAYKRFMKKPPSKHGGLVAALPSSVRLLLGAT